MFAFIRSSSAVSMMARNATKIGGQSTSTAAAISTSTPRHKRHVFSRRPKKILTDSGKDYFRYMDTDVPTSSAAHEYRPNGIANPTQRKGFNKYYDEGFTDDYMAEDDGIDDSHRLSADTATNWTREKRQILKNKRKSIPNSKDNQTINEEMFEDKRDVHKSHAKTKKSTSDKILTPKIAGIPVYQRLGDDNTEFLKVMSDMKNRKRRETTNQMVLEGKRLISDAIGAGIKPKTIYFSKEDHLVGIPALNELVSNGLQLKKILYRDIKLFSELVSGPGLIAVTERPDNHKQFVKDSPNGQQLPLILIGDNIRDPGNLGTMVRCAAAVGAMSVVVTRGCTDVWSNKVLRSAAGAHFRVPIVSDVEWPLLFNYIPIDKPFDLYIAESNDDFNYKSAVNDAKKLNGGSESFPDVLSHTVNTITKSYSQTNELTVLRDQSYDKSNEELSHYRSSPIASTNYCDTKFYTSGIDRPTVLVIGGETHGLSDESYKLAYDYIGRKIRIPLAAGVDSLNSAMAATVIMYEMKRQFHCLQNCRDSSCAEQIV